MNVVILNTKCEVWILNVKQDIRVKKTTCEQIAFLFTQKCDPT